MDIQEALNVAASMEASFASSQEPDRNSNFGHPETPRLALQKLSSASPTTTATTTNHSPRSDKHDNLPPTAEEDVYLLVVYTKHCIVAQVVALTTSDPKEAPATRTPVLQLASILNDETSLYEDSEDQEEVDDPVLVDYNGEEQKPADEIIQSLLVVELENLSICSGRLELRNDLARPFVLAIVLGTNHSRVLVSEVLVQQKIGGKNNDWTIESLSVSQHGNSLFDVLPRDTSGVADFIRRQNKQLAKEQAARNKAKSSDLSTKAETLEVVQMSSFQPFGGVTNLSCSFDAHFNPNESNTCYIWITYKDGNLVRMHHAALFPSIWAEGSDKDISVDELLSQYHHTALFRCQLRLPPGEEDNVTIVPLPKFYPSPLAPVSFSALPNHSKQNYEMCYEALVFGSSSTSTFPTLCVYTTEDHFYEPQPAQKSDSLVADVTKALVGGVVGALRWATSSNEAAVRSSSGGDGSETLSLPSSPFPSLWKMPVPLFAGSEFHDVPRFVEHCAIDPDGNYTALADGLGRVLLFDLSTKQIIRMWKGLRQATCAWTKVPFLEEDGQSIRQAKNYLVMYSKQRRVLEVWPPQSGSRLAAFQVHRDSKIVSCPGTMQHQEKKNLVRDHDVFILDSGESGGPATMLKRIEIVDLLKQQQVAKQGNGSSRTSSREATMHVQHLKQILSAEKAMNFSKEDVLEAFSRIKSLSDLSSCLDLVASAPVLEEDLNVQGSSFQKSALKYCSDILQTAVREKGEGLQTDAATKLSKKIDYFSCLIKAYDLLQGYEATLLDEGSKAKRPLSNFALEAMSWADTYEKVTKQSLDAELRATEYRNNLKFYQFASSCVFPVNDTASTQKKMRIYLSESSRTRQEVLFFLLRPLLGWFSSGIVGAVFDALGIRDDYPYVMKCFGEWFLNLKRSDIEERCLSQPDSPMSRFLLDVTEREFDAGKESSNAMQTLATLCEQSTDLVRAFMLATLAVYVQRRLSEQKEESTFATSGNASKWFALTKQLDQTTNDITTLLRKARVCLLVSLRLDGKDIAPFPISIQNIEKEKDFSVFKWVALDELSQSQRHEEIVTLEIACGLSPYNLNPFTPRADEPDKFRLIQRSCLGPSGKTIVTGNFESNNDSLLLFLSEYNQPEVLAAHRALLLASDWIQSPQLIKNLQGSVSAMKSLPKRTESISTAFAVTLDVWSRVIAPVYRAQLFGFSEVPEINEEEFVPLLHSSQWLTEFGRLALQVLMLMRETSFDGNDSEQNEQQESLAVDASENDQCWPPIKTTDNILDALTKKATKVDSTAVETHVVVVCALLFSTDENTLTDCIPSLGDCFHRNSLQNAMNAFPCKTHQQEAFLSEAVVRLANEYRDGPLDSFRILAELEQLSSRWGFDKKWLRTTFLIAMYELGKDADVDDLMTSAGSQILAQQLLVAGVNTVCRRLDHFLLKTKASRSPEARNILGLLDAELCDWIHHRAESCEPVVPSFSFDLSLKATQILTIRLLSLGSSTNAEAGIRTRIHALSVLSGTLVKATEASG